jgi:thiamine-phosphate pyrophosphorylase
LKLDKNSMLLYVVTDRTWLDGKNLVEQVEDTIKAGATFVQLREKEMDFNSLVAEAKEIKALTDRYHIPFVINDNVEAAIAAGADGVHVGQSDMSAKDVRKLLGKDKILGVSVQTVGQALLAEKSGADYLGVGTIFSTSTKLDADSVSYIALKEICRAVSIPVVAIGGINEQNILELKGSGVNGVAVISAIFAKHDIFAAAKKIYELSKEIATL